LFIYPVPIAIGITPVDRPSQVYAGLYSGLRSTAFTPVKSNPDQPFEAWKNRFYKGWQTYFFNA
jgi:hypothetical protein